MRGCTVTMWSEFVANLFAFKDCTAVQTAQQQKLGPVCGLAFRAIRRQIARWTSLSPMVMTTVTKVGLALRFGGISTQHSLLDKLTRLGRRKRIGDIYQVDVYKLAWRKIWKVIVTLT